MTHPETLTIPDPDRSGPTGNGGVYLAPDTVTRLGQLAAQLFATGDLHAAATFIGTCEAYGVAVPR